jgi:hypothetical protein
VSAAESRKAATIRIDQVAAADKLSTTSATNASSIDPLVERVE